MDTLESQQPVEQQLLDLADLCLNRAAQQSASAAAVALARGEGKSVTVRNGETETIEYHRDKSLSITVYCGHRAGTASSTDFSEKALLQAVDSACNIARYTEEDPFNGLADADKLATLFPDLDLYHPWNIPTETALELASRCEQTALQHDRRITNSEGSSFSSYGGVGLYANSHGFRGLDWGSQYSNSCTVIAGQGSAMQRDYWYDSCRVPRALADPEDIGRRAAARVVQRLHAHKIKTGTWPILFEADVASTLLSHLIDAISGSSLYRKASFLLEQKGQSIFPDFIRVHEQPHLKTAAASSNFDNEGVATQARDIVRAGVLQDYVLSSYAARKLGQQTTANAGGVRNLTLDSSIDGGVDSLLKQMHKGIMITELIGFGVNTVTGDYSRGAFGFWVEDGQIQYPVQEFTIAGNLKDMFKHIVAVGNDANPHRSTRNGSILLDNMTVAGQ